VEIGKQQNVLRRLPALLQGHDSALGTIALIGQGISGREELGVFNGQRLPLVLSQVA
jgi:hypothetical protein